VRETFKRLKWNEKDFVERKKGDAGKVKIALRLRRETTLTLAPFAERLKMSNWANIANLMGANQKQQSIVRTDACTAVAYPHDEEHFDSHQVAFGPQPRISLCKPSYESGYDGSEWALIVYRPICQLWATQKGFAKPAKWR
jgi:hypothetical protein